jgi:3-keto-disaccharide hydrolase
MWCPRLLAVCASFGAACLIGCGSSDDDSPGEWRSLFDGSSLEAWDTYLGAPHSTFERLGVDESTPIDPSLHLGLNNDPDGVFSIISLDGERVLRISGEIFGAIISHESFSNYALRLEYRWGEIRWPPRLDQPRDSGLLYHSVGPPGLGHNAWMRSHECQVEEGHTGDYYTVAGAMNRTRGVPEPGSAFYRYDPWGEPIELSGANWLCQGTADFEGPHGAWNVVEVYALQDESVHVVNGHVVNRLAGGRQIDSTGADVPMTGGKVQVQSEGAEVFVRSVMVRQIDHIPSALR